MAKPDYDDLIRLIRDIYLDGHIESSTLSNSVKDVLRQYEMWVMAGGRP